MADDENPVRVAVERLRASGRVLPFGLDEDLAGWVSLTDFLADEAAVRAFLAYEAGFSAGTDQKAAAAFMFMDYSLGLTAFMVPLFLLAGLVPDLDPGRVLLQFRHALHHHDGHAHEQREVWFRTGGAEVNPDLTSLCDSFRREAEHHLAPLIERLSELTRLPRRALWRLAADTIAASFLEEGRNAGREGEARELALRIIRQPGSPLNNPQVGYFTLSVPDAAGGVFAYTFRARGGCCRFYTVEGGELCKTCVLKPEAARDADLRAAMRHHLGLSPVPG